MNFLIVGCGKVGSKLSSSLSRDGHDVAVVSNHGEDFRQLDSDFKGLTIEGVEVDQDVLQRAGISACDCLAAVSSDDNINIMVAQLAKRIFKVPKVITRILDPEREEVFSHFGLQTVCPTRLIVDAVSTAALESELVQKNVHFGNSTLTFATLPIEPDMVGMTLAEVGTMMAEEQKQFIGALHLSGDVTMLAESPSRTIISSDRLIVSHRID